MNAIVRTFIDGPERLSRPLVFLGPLAARIVVGWVFLWSGWTKLHNLPQMIQNFSDWGIPFPEIMTPFVSGVEFVGGLLLLLGLFTRIAGPALVIVMVVATIAAKLDQVDSLETPARLRGSVLHGPVRLARRRRSRPGLAGLSPAAPDRLEGHVRHDDGASCEPI